MTLAAARRLAFLLAIAALPSRASAGIWYVKRNAGPGGNGASWATAFQTVQDGIAAAQAGDQVWAAKAIYRPGSGASPRTASFQLKAGVAVYGGFAGGEILLAQRDWKSNETILSGDLNLDDGPGFVNRADNCYHVVTANAFGTSAALDGFVIEGGNANGSGSNGLGGGIFGVSGTPAYRNLLVRDNSAVQGGGLNSYAGASLTACTIRGNLAGEAGGLQVVGNLGLSDCVVAGNQATGNYGGVHADSGGSTFMDNCLIVGNTAGGVGGGAVADYTVPYITNCAIAYNHAHDWGGIVSGAFSTGNVSNSILWGNTAVAGIQQLDSGGWLIQATAVQGTGGTFSLDPLWVNALGPDGIVGTEDDDFRLSCLSPYIDRGNNSVGGSGVDLAGNPRRLDDPATPDQGTGTAPIIDLGPYEFLCGCDQATSYCPALPNTSGGPMSISWTGSTSLFANNFTLLVTGGPPNKNGLFFYGAQPTAIPWGDGIRCVGGALQRLPVIQLDAAGAGSWHLDFTSNPAGPGGSGQIDPGSQRNFQFYFRDPLGGPAGWNYSDALEVSFCR